MFKRIASIAIAALMLGSTAVVAASAVEADEAVAAADESAVGADDNSAVGANEDTGSTGSGNVVYFEVPGDWKNFDKITIYLSGHTSGESNTFAWGSKKGFMTDEGNGIWSYDLAEKGYNLSGDAYSCIFTASATPLIAPATRSRTTLTPTRRAMWLSGRAATTATP